MTLNEPPVANNCPLTQKGTASGSFRQNSPVGPYGHRHSPGGVNDIGPKAVQPRLIAFIDHSRDRK